MSATHEGVVSDLVEALEPVQSRPNVPEPIEGSSDEVSQFVAIACFVPLALSLLFVLLQPCV